MGLSKALTEKVMVTRSRNLNGSGTFLCGTCSVARKDIRIIGTRHGEKKYVTLVNREEMVKADTTPILPFYHFTVLPLYRFTTLPFYHFTILPLYRFTTLPFHHFTVLPLYRFTTLPFYHFTVLPLYRFTYPP